MILNGQTMTDYIFFFNKKFPTFLGVGGGFVEL